MRKSRVLALARILRASGASRVLGARYRGIGTILRLHSIVPDPALYLHDQTRTSTAFLDRFCLWLRRGGLDVISLEEGLARLAEPAPRRFVVMSIDDGYADNLTQALPVFARHGMPFTVYVTTGMITRQMSFWWGGLQALFRDHDSVEIEPMGRRFDCATLEGKMRAVGEVSVWVHGDIPARSAQLAGSFAAGGVDVDALLDAQALTVDQLRTLAAHKLVTIGAHTSSHPKLSHLTPEQARADIADNRDFLEATLDRKVEHFAYPFGDATACGERERALVAGLGFKSAVTTRLGNLFPEHARHLHALPRAGFTADTEDIGYMAAMMDGAVQFIRTRGGAPVATM